MVIDKQKVKRILCIKLKGIGDVVLATIVLENLRNDFPNAEIDFLTEPPSKDILENNPSINNILIFNKKKSFGSPAVIFDVMKRNYDLVIDLYSNPRTALITYLSFANYRAGFPYKGRSYAYNLKGPLEREKFHSADLHLELLKQIGLSHSSKELFIGQSSKDIEFAENYFKTEIDTSIPTVAISPSGGWQSKKCDPVKFAEFADEAAKIYNINFLIVWGPGDKKEAEEISSAMKSKNVLAPPTTIGQMGALLKRCSFVIANDSGPMHIAVALGCAVLSLHGPTNPLMQGPYGAKNEWVWNDELDCINCNLLICPKKHECFMELPVKKVLNKIEILAKKNNIKLELK